ncbi:MAG: sigma-70 family RNA polymerase sigma factor [Actinobacteria bacterium]|nr:sigma-70 family RNA polymerase sigma factor [Actinomycetota bacterium]
MTSGDAGPDLARLTDEELVRGIARVEPAAFDVLYRRHGAAAFALARRMLGSQARAEDAVQEAFISLWRTARRYDSARGSVRSWLLGIVRNRSIDVLRGLDVHQRRRIEMENFEGRVAAPHETEADVVRREQARRVQSALATLPRDQRRVLELAYFGGWTQTEIAEHLELPLGTVKSRTRLGLKKLRCGLDEIVSEPE